MARGPRDLAQPNSSTSPLPPPITCYIPAPRASHLPVPRPYYMHFLCLGTRPLSLHLLPTAFSPTRFQLYFLWPGSLAFLNLVETMLRVPFINSTTPYTLLFAVRTTTVTEPRLVTMCLSASPPGASALWGQGPPPPRSPRVHCLQHAEIRTAQKAGLEPDRPGL